MLLVIRSKASREGGRGGEGRGCLRRPPKLAGKADMIDYSTAPTVYVERTSSVG